MLNSSDRKTTADWFSEEQQWIGNTVVMLVRGRELSELHLLLCTPAVIEGRGGKQCYPKTFQTAMAIIGHDCPGGV